jgi:hypothetical protein
MGPASYHLVRLDLPSFARHTTRGPIENPGPSIFAGASRKDAGRVRVGCATLAAARSNVWQVVRESNPRARVLETREIPDPDLRWSDRRDSNPHCRVGSAAVFRTTSDRINCPGAIRTLIVALNKRSHCRDYATGHQVVEVQGIEP